MTEMKHMDHWAKPFVKWDLHLYLDTHPTCTGAMTAYRALAEAMPGGTPANLSSDMSGCMCGDKWTWIDGPWPWEPEANLCDGR